jgi:pentatricopeptide repeat protein
VATEETQSSLRDDVSLSADNGVIVPDELLVSVLIRAHGSKDPPAWTEISRLLGSMKNVWSLPPRNVTYNVLLELCARTNDYDRGCQLIDRMLDEGVQPDSFTVAAVSSRKSLRSYLRRGLDEDAAVR